MMDDEKFIQNYLNEPSERCKILIFLKIEISVPHVRWSVGTNI